MVKVYNSFKRVLTTSEKGKFSKLIHSKAALNSYLPCSGANGTLRIRKFNLTLLRGSEVDPTKILTEGLRRAVATNTVAGHLNRPVQQSVNTDVVMYERATKQTSLTLNLGKPSPFAPP